MLARTLILSVFVALSSSAAMAYEKFIPQGHSYTPDNTELPDFNSAQGKFDLQTDIYETEIYIRRRDQRVRDSYMKRFSSSQETRGADYSIDY